jgi:hypothetical protein
MEPVPVLDTPQVVVQEVETVEQLMETVDVVLIVTYLIPAAQMLPVQEVIISYSYYIIIAFLFIIIIPVYYYNYDNINVTYSSKNMCRCWHLFMLHRSTGRIL